MLFRVVNKYSVTLALLIPAVLSANVVWLLLWWALTVVVVFTDVFPLWKE